MREPLETYENKNRKPGETKNDPRAHNDESVRAPRGNQKKTMNDSKGGPHTVLFLQASPWKPMFIGPLAQVTELWIHARDHPGSSAVLSGGPTRGPSSIDQPSEAIN